MATTLWDKFKSTVRWVVADTDAAVAILQAADTPEPERLLDGASTTNGAPSDSADGKSIAGLRIVNLYYRHSQAGETSKLKIHLYDGDSGESSDADRWWEWREYDLDRDEDIKEPIYLEGNWERMYAELTTPPSSGDVTVKVGPHMESGNTD